MGLFDKLKKKKTNDEIAEEGRNLRGQERYLITISIYNVKLSEIYPLIKQFCAGESMSSLNTKLQNKEPLLTCDFIHNYHNFKALVMIADEFANRRYDFEIREVFDENTSRIITLEILHNLLNTHDEIYEEERLFMDLESPADE